MLRRAVLALFVVARSLPADAAPAIQDSVQIRQLAGAREIAGMTCVGYDFTIAKLKNVTIVGTAGLEAATGVPVRFASTPKPLPMGVHDMSTVVRYEDGFVSEVRVEGSGSIVFIKRRFVSVLTFGGWFERPGG